jgi:hypothetical protein
VYYLEIEQNATYYSIQLNAFAFPTALPAGYTNPNSLTFPATASTPQFVILNNDFTNVIGFTPQTFPPSIEATTQSALSDYVPQVDSVQSVIIGCSLINNRYSNPSNLLYPFTASNSDGFGSLISVSPNDTLYLDVSSGLYRSFQINFLDQNYRKLQIRDTNILVQLAFKVKEEVPSRSF